MTGARRGALCALCYTDIDADRRRVTIGRGIVHGSDGPVEKDTKTHLVQRVALDERTLRRDEVHRLREQLAGHWAGTVVNCLRAGAPLIHGTNVSGPPRATATTSWPEAGIVGLREEAQAQSEAPTVRVGDECPCMLVEAARRAPLAGPLPRCMRLGRSLTR